MSNTYKVGDRVKIVSVYEEGDDTVEDEIGRIVTILKVNKEYSYPYEVTGSRYKWRDEELIMCNAVNLVGGKLIKEKDGSKHV